MNLPTKKTTYLIGVGTSLITLAGIVTTHHSAQVAEEAAFVLAQNQNTNQSIANQNINAEVAENRNTNTQVASTNVSSESLSAHTNTAANLNTRTSTNVNTSNASVVNRNVNTSAVQSGSTGTFTTSITYSVPEGATERCDVSITLANDIVTNSSVSCIATVSESRRYQSAFINAYKTQVTGKAIATVRLSRVGGATLTTNAFNTAINQIRSQL